MTWKIHEKNGSFGVNSAKGFASASMAGSDTTSNVPPVHGFTILTCSNNTMTKVVEKQTLKPNEKDSIRLGGGKYFSTDARSFEGPEDLFNTLAGLMDSGGRYCLVPGALAIGLDPTVRHERNGATFVDTPSNVFIMDIDKVAVPEPLGKGEQFTSAVDYMINELGGSFRSVSFVAVATAGTGRRGETTGNARLFFLLSRPLTVAQQKCFSVSINADLKARGSCLRLDLTIYSPEHILFVCRPEWRSGVFDPVPADQRTLRFKGLSDTLALPETLDLTKTPEIPKSQSAEGARPTGGSFLNSPAGKKVLDVVPQAPFELIERIVMAIPNDENFDDRDEWVAVAYGIKSATRGSPEGFDIWDSWCERWVNGPGDPVENRRVYESANNGRVGLDWLVGLARKYGGAEGLAAATAHARWLFGLHPLGPEDVSPLDRMEDPEAPDAAIDSLNEHYAFVHSRPDCVVDLRGDKDHVCSTLKVQSFKNILAPKRVRIADGKELRYTPAAVYWFNNPRRREYDDIGFYPLGQEPVGHFNAWKGLALEPVAGTWLRIEHFLFAVICNGDASVYGFLLRLIQWKIQNPTIRPEVGVVLLGVPGTGKGTFYRLLECIFGVRYCWQFGRATDAGNRFNKAEEGRVVLFYDECHFGHKLSDKSALKSQITEPMISIEPKCVDTYRVQNMALRIYASNEIAALPIDTNDRRFLVLEVSSAQAADTAYWASVNAAIDGNEVSAFVKEALAADLSAFDTERRSVPKTAARAELAEATEDRERQYLRLVLARGASLSGCWDARPWPSQSSPDPSNVWTSGPISIAARDLHDDYAEHMKSNHRGAPIRSQGEIEKLFRALGTDANGKYLYRSEPTHLPNLGSVRRRYMAPLSEMRAAFDKQTGSSNAWDEPHPLRTHGFP